MLGYCCLRIYGEAINFEQLSNHLCLQPISKQIKGEVIKKGYGDIIVEKDGWFYEIQFSSNQGFEDALNRLLTELEPSKEYLKEIKKKYFVRIWLDIYAEGEQVGIELSSSMIKRLSALEIGVDLGVFCSNTSCM